MNWEYIKHHAGIFLLLLPLMVTGQGMTRAQFRVADHPAEREPASGPGMIHAQSATPVFDQLKQQFEEERLFTAAFTHSYTDSYTGEEFFSSGRIWIGKEMYRVEGDEQVMVVDGETSRVYDGIRNRLLVNDYDEETDDFAPSRMLRGVDESYIVNESKESGQTVITLENDDPFALFYTVEIRLGDEGIPEEIIATDQAENIIVTNFSNGRFMPFNNTIFEIDLPENAERVDLRH